MSILSVHNLGKYYGAQDIFSHLEATIARGDKIALVGPNGAGKTTLIRIMLGLEPASQGTVERARNLRIGYLPQQPEFSGDGVLYDEMLSVFADLRDQEKRLQDLTQEMATATQHSEALMERYADAEHRFDIAGGYVYEQQISRVLSGLGFGEETYDWPIALLSGGQVTRALLAKLLLEDPELLILDEPTNYLDLDALEWLESYLLDWPRSLMVISHDRYFLDRVVTRIWEMAHGRLETYRGNYSHYVEQREARFLRRQREYEAQQAFIAKTEDFIRRYKAGQRTREAQGRETRLERLERIEAPKSNKRIRLRLKTDLRAGDNVLSSDGAVIGHAVSPAKAGEAVAAQAVASHGEFPLFETGPFLIQRGDRVALLGPNGSGKTTFLRTLMGQLEPLSGALRIGASLRMGYLPQSQSWLDPDKKVLDQILDMSDYSIQQARDLLGRFLFSGDDVYKMTGDLSGGELARVALSVLSISDPNFLILDEPTTHLDVTSQEILQDVLADFGGTVLLVSHDRYLIDALATHVFWIEDGRLHTIEGNYSAYVAYRREKRAARSDADTNGRARNEQLQQQRREQAAERRREEQMTELEAEIERVERELTATTGMIERASKVQDVGRLRKLGDEYQRLESLLAQKLREWERISTVSADAN